MFVWLRQKCWFSQFWSYHLHFQHEVRFLIRNFFSSSGKYFFSFIFIILFFIYLSDFDIILLYLKQSSWDLSEQQIMYVFAYKTNKLLFYLLWDQQEKFMKIMPLFTHPIKM